MKYNFGDPIINEFLAWEVASRDTIDFKRIYVDVTADPAEVADRGDLIAGLLLSQVVYWFLPSKDKKSRVFVRRDGKLWLAKEREDWWEEIRISPKQFDRAAKILVNRGLTETRVLKFNGNPTCAISPNFSVIIVAIKLKLEEKKQTTKPCGRKFLPKGEEGISQKGKNDLAQIGKSLTEITPEITNPPPPTPPVTEEEEKKLPHPFNTLTPAEARKISARCIRMGVDYRLHGHEAAKKYKNEPVPRPCGLLLKLLDDPTWVEGLDRAVEREQTCKASKQAEQEEVRAEEEAREKANREAQDLDAYFAGLAGEEQHQIRAEAAQLVPAVLRGSPVALRVEIRKVLQAQGGRA